MGGGGGAHPHSRSFGNLVSPPQPLEYPPGLTSNTGGYSRPRAAFSDSGSGAQTHYFRDRGEHDLGEGIYGGKLERWWWMDGEELDGVDGVEASVGGVREGNASDVLDGENVHANAAPEYRVSFQGCVPPLPGLVGLPSYEEAAGSGVRQGKVTVWST
ncbi:uncharacterized protein F5147DRAFT_816208 [Suillus discolor]|uniref:Uncharacterized protein n=1 Tax=Suillus discolor TaxID=1912936 RepID=A0A9P7JQ78_9AGAM|nr:uncharacterized protein F5147DRAFT_816208 [Suillus discolor]KAG2097943.1 hypothetical protein F5147DRAFT_816208 [Suillus discolor]